MIEIIKKHIKEVENYNAESKENSESFRIKYLGKKGILNELFKKFKDIDANERKIIGKEINILKLKVKKKLLESQSEKNEAENNLNEDLYKPGYPIEFGSQHPLNIVRKKIIEIFEKIGYCITEGPEIEDDWHNFTALNLPKHHPARDMQDTFFINRDPDILLRTHTSSVQIRHMEQNSPPIKTISPGRVYRNEDISARSHCLFHQVEGLYIDEEVSLIISFELVYSFKRNVKLISKETKINTKDKTKSLETLHKSDIDKIITTKRRFKSNDQKIIRIESRIGFSMQISIFL